MNSLSLSEILSLAKGVSLEKLFSVSPATTSVLYRDPEVERLREIQKRSAPLPKADPDKESVLYFLNRPWREHVAFEEITARALRMRRHRVDVVCADRLPQPVLSSKRLNNIEKESLPWSYNIDDWLNSLHTANYIRAVMCQYELPVTNLSAWIEGEERRRIKDLIQQYSGEWTEFEYRGYPVGKWCETSVAWQLTGETIDESLPHVQWLYQRAIYAASVTATAFERGIAVTEPDVLVVFNGIFAPERAAFEIARHHGVRVVTHEAGFHQGSHVLAHNGPANYYQYDAEWEVRKDRPLSEDERIEIRTYLQRRDGKSSDGGRVDYWPSVTEDHEEIRRTLNLDPSRSTLVLFPNIVWDSAVLRRDVAFEGLLDWVLYTIDLIGERSGIQLVIRSHPAEVQLGRATSERVEKRVNEVLSSVPSNVRIVPPESDISSYRLMEMSDAVVVYTSTTGLEAAVRGNPVVVAGETHYRGKGFTIDVETKEEYRELLDSGLSQRNPTDEELRRAEQYAHLFFLETTISLPYFSDTDSRLGMEYHLDSFDELDSKKNGTLDRLCKSIAKGESFVYDDLSSKDKVLKDATEGVFG